MHKVIIYIGNKRIRRVFKFQVALLLAWKMWEEQPTAILLNPSWRREILLLVNLEGWHEGWQLLPFQSDQGNQYVYIYYIYIYTGALISLYYIEELALLTVNNCPHI